MINIKTEIGRNRVQYSWDKRIRGLKGNSLWMEYDVDISTMPRYLANMMFGLIACDPFSWENRTVVFDELSLEGLECLNNFLKMYFHSKGAGGLLYKYGDNFPKVPSASIRANELVVSDQREDNGPILCANGLGKDGITISSMTKELGFDMRCVFLDGQLTRKVRNHHLNAMNEYYKMRSIESNIIKTNFYQIKRSWTGSYPYFYLIPLAHHYGSEVILSGTSLHQNKTWKNSEHPAIYSPGESSFAFNYATKGSGVTFSSPNRSLSLYGVQKLLLDRYPETSKYQRSCMHGSPWCNSCQKCYRHHLWYAAYGNETTSIELIPEKSADKDFFWKTNIGAFGLSSNTALNCLKKLYGEPYETWIEEANKTALELMWRQKDYEEIITDHFDIYDYDRDDDGFGWMLQPSKWRGWMDKGFE